MTLSRLIYISEPQFDPAAGSIISQLGTVMSASNRNNRAAGVTGALVYDESWFLQALEGERRTIWQTYKRIEEDERHANCLLVEMVDVDERLFGNWWMGLGVRDEATAPFFAPFVSKGSLCAADMGARDILALMTALSKRGLRREMNGPASKAPAMQAAE